MISLKTLYRQVAFHAVILLTFGWRGTVFANGFEAEFEGYCACLEQNPEASLEHCANAFLIDTPPLLTPGCGVRLLQPFDDATYYLQPGNGNPFETFKMYFKISWPLIIGSAAGIAVLWAIVAGIEIMLSGSDSGMRDKGKNHLYSAIVGLLLIGLAGMILEILNPIYFKQ